MAFQIGISIDEAGLKKIYDADQSVTLIKSVKSLVETGALSSSSQAVAWLVFQPLEENQVSWIESYCFYATTTPLENGAVLQMNSQTSVPVQPGWLYVFAQGEFNYEISEADSGYRVSNQMQGSFSFGMAQSATVNDGTALAPLNAIPVLFNEEATFTPDETVSIFLSSCTANGTVVPQIPDEALTIALSSQSPAACVGFNDETDLFYLVPCASVTLPASRPIGE